jgi:hypothetical protein
MAPFRASANIPFRVRTSGGGGPRGEPPGGPLKPDVPSTSPRAGDCAFGDVEYFASSSATLSSGSVDLVSDSFDDMVLLVSVVLLSTGAAKSSMIYEGLSSDTA